MNAPGNDWQKLQNILILLLVFSFCLYLPSLFFEAFADDDVYLAFANHFLRESHWSDLYQFFLKPANPVEFLPLRDLTYWLDFRLYGDELSGFHATNLVWYAATSLASFWMFRELILLCKSVWTERATMLALCGTIIFVVHPAHVEVVAWIASRKDLVAGTFGFLSVAMLVRTMHRHWSCRAMVLAALSFFAACFGKAAAMTIILFVTVLICAGENVFPEVSRTKRLSTLSLFLTLFTAAFLVHLNVGEASGVRIENHPGFLVMIERASRIITALLGILLFPYPLHFYYDVYSIGDWHWLVTGFAALLLTVSLRVLSRRPSLWALGIILMISPLFIYLQMIPFTTWSLASERFVFVAVAGLALVLIDLFGRIDNPTKIGGFILLIVLPCSIVVWNRISEWGDNPNSLLFREYALQPNFHNAIRDRIVFLLLPEKRYVEAAELARQVPRIFIADALVSLIATEQIYRQMIEGEPTALTQKRVKNSQDFCMAVDVLQLAIKNGHAHIPYEPDISYNNIIRTLDQQFKFRYGNGKIVCVNSELELN